MDNCDWKSIERTALELDNNKINDATHTLMECIEKDQYFITAVKEREQKNVGADLTVRGDWPGRGYLPRLSFEIH